MDDESAGTYVCGRCGHALELNEAHVCPLQPQEDRMIKLGEETLDMEKRVSKRTLCRHCAKTGQGQQKHEDRKDPKEGWVSICLNCGMVDKADA